MESRWKRLALISASAGAGVIAAVALIGGGVLWYASRPAKAKPWNTKAIVAAFDYPDTESDNPKPPAGYALDKPKPETLVLFYTLENTTDSDYRMPGEDQLELNGKLKRQKSLAGHKTFSLDKESFFLPARQRMRFAIHLGYPVNADLGPEPRTREDHRRRWKLIADYMKKEFPNLDGFVIFDHSQRYQIELPNGWDNIDLK